MRKLKKNETGIILYSDFDCRKKSIKGTTIKTGEKGITSYSGDMYTLVNMVMCAMENDEVIEQIFTKAVLHYMQENDLI